MRAMQESVPMPLFLCHTSLLIQRVSGDERRPILYGLFCEGFTYAIKEPGWTCILRYARSTAPALMGTGQAFFLSGPKGLKLGSLLVSPSPAGQDAGGLFSDEQPGQ